MKAKAYYNEIDPYAAQWLRNLIAEGHIAPGDVDERSIVDVRAADLDGYTQCHFFAGIGGWSYALRLAGWPDTRPVWTGSCPCQPFSNAGKQRGFDDDRHLWPIWREVIRERRPAAIFGEQVASAADWLRLVRSDLEALGYAVGAIPFEAASAGRYHRRDRYGIVAHTSYAQSQEQEGHDGFDKQWQKIGRRKFEPARARTDGRIDGGPDAARIDRCGTSSAHRSDVARITGADGKARPIKPGLRMLADGVSRRVDLLRGFGNAIDPEAFAIFISAAAEAMTVTRLCHGTDGAMK